MSPLPLANTCGAAWKLRDEVERVGVAEDEEGAEHEADVADAR